MYKSRDLVIPVVTRLFISSVIFKSLNDCIYNKDGKAQRGSIVYIQGKDVMLRFISTKEDRVEQIN